MKIIVCFCIWAVAWAIPVSMPSSKKPSYFTISLNTHAYMCIHTHTHIYICVYIFFLRSCRSADPTLLDLHESLDRTCLASQQN